MVLRRLGQHAQPWEKAAAKLGVLKFHCRTLCLVLLSHVGKTVDSNSLPEGFLWASSRPGHGGTMQS